MSKAVIFQCGLPQERTTMPLVTSGPSEVEGKDLVLRHEVHFKYLLFSASEEKVSNHT